MGHVSCGCRIAMNSFLCQRELLVVMFPSAINLAIVLFLAGEQQPRGVKTIWNLTRSDNRD